MGIKTIFRFFAFILLIGSICSCRSSSIQIRSAYFRSFTCETNKVYECYQPRPDSCTMISTASATMIAPHSLSKEMILLSENLVYSHLRAIATKKDKRQRSANGLLSFDGLRFGNHSKVLPVNFEFNGILCREYDVVAVPFVVINEEEHVLLEEVMTAFYHNGKFCFALYVTLNDCTVSFDFKRGTKSFLLLYYIATYPYLSPAEYWIQCKYVTDNCRSANGVNANENRDEHR